MTEVISSVNHDYNSLVNLLKKTLAPILHDLPIVEYEANRLTNGLLYINSTSLTSFHIQSISHSWLAIQPTIAAMLYDSKKTVITITRDLCINIGHIHGDQVHVDSSHVFSTVGSPNIYMLNYDVLLLKVIN